MIITKDTLLKDILAEYPWLREELVKKNEKFRLLDTPPGRIFLRKATLEDLSRKAGRTPERMISRLEQMIADHENGGKQL